MLRTLVPESLSSGACGAAFTPLMIHGCHRRSDPRRPTLVGRELDGGPRVIKPDDRALLSTLGIHLAEVRARVEATFGPDAIDELYDGGDEAGAGLPVGRCVAWRGCLLGLLEVEDGMAARLLRSLGADSPVLRARLRPRAAG